MRIVVLDTDRGEKLIDGVGLAQKQLAAPL